MLIKKTRPDQVFNNLKAMVSFYKIFSQYLDLCQDHCPSGPQVLKPRSGIFFWIPTEELISQAVNFFTIQVKNIEWAYWRGSSQWVLIWRNMFRIISFYLMKQFWQISSYLPKWFRQIKSFYLIKNLSETQLSFCLECSCFNILFC